MKNILLVRNLGLSVFCGLALTGVLTTRDCLAATPDFQGLAIEGRQKEIKQKASRQGSSSEETKGIEQERELIRQQLAVITGSEDMYVIVPGDTITVSFSDRGETVSNMYQVSAKGEIHLPLVGAVKIDGLTRPQVVARIDASLSEYIRYPQARMKINQTGEYMVVGAGGPGVYELSPNLTLMEAILKSGYDENRANLGNVIVMRGGVDDPVVLNMNLKKMIKQGDRTDNIPIKPGDLIYIPNTLIYNFDTFKDKMLSYVLDYYTLGGTTLLNRTQKENSVNE